MFLLAPQLLAVSLVSHTRSGNRVWLRLNEGAAELEWITPSSFRFRRVFTGELPAREGPDRPAVNLRMRESAVALSMESRYLVVSVSKSGLQVRVRKMDGTPVLSDFSEARHREGVVSWERSAATGARFYGLGMREGGLDARGSVVETRKPFLVSTSGYGEDHVAPGTYRFDMTRQDRYRVEIRGGGRIDYYFFYGPTPKEIFEERLAIAGTPDGTGKAGWREMLQAGMSGIFYRAAAVAALLPEKLRAGLPAYFATYTQEMRERGLPIVRALALQFPSDARAADRSGEFMIGDELLVAPGAREVYLPMGIWTDLESNAVFKGRQVIATESQFPVLARNGTILPLGNAPMELHYFPKLAAEFFVYEEEAGDYSQVHAGPAADFMRLEIESKVDREYEWVVHHIEGVSRVEAGGTDYAQAQDAAHLRDGTWYYDAPRKNLQVRARVAAGQDHIVNLSF